MLTATPSRKLYQTCLCKSWFPLPSRPCPRNFRWPQMSTRRHHIFQRRPRWLLPRIGGPVLGGRGGEPGPQTSLPCQESPQAREDDRGVQQATQPAREMARLRKILGLTEKSYERNRGWRITPPGTGWSMGGSRNPSGQSCGGSGGHHPGVVPVSAERHLGVRGLERRSATGILPVRRAWPG
jgi:hypothetical protein